MNTKIEYEIFGPEWEKEVSKMPKEVIIKMWAESGKKKTELFDALCEIEITCESKGALLRTPHEKRIHEIAAKAIKNTTGL